MGQCYHIINVDKRQQLLPSDYDNGLKLMEWSYDKNHMVLALMNLLCGEWKGDRVYVIGDYANLEYPDEVWAGTLSKLMEEFDTDSLYNLSGDQFLRILPDKDAAGYLPLGEDGYPDKASIAGCTKGLGYRYIYNHATRHVIDTAKCPIEWSWYDDDTGKGGVTKVAPLPLLLAMGNGRGGGDYRNKGNANLVGSWCETSSSIEVTKEPMGSAADYEEFAPDFTELDELVPWTAEAEEIAKAEEKARNQKC